MCHTVAICGQMKEEFDAEVKAKVPQSWRDRLDAIAAQRVLTVSDLVRQGVKHIMDAESGLQPSDKLLVR